MIKWQWILLVTAIPVTALAVRLLDRRPPGVAIREHEGQERALEARLAALEARERSSGVQRLVSARAAPTPAPEESAAAADAGPRRVTAPDLKAAALLESKFEAEPVDPKWAQSAEREYRGVIDGQLPKESRFGSLECRSEFCRLEVAHQSIEASNDFLMHLFSMKAGRALGSSAGGFRAAQPTVDPDGKLAYVVYIARPGVSVGLEPSPDSPRGAE